jgi:hypothetical protein
MSKYHESIKAICPVYKHESSSMIYCEGPGDTSTIHLAFSTRSSAYEYKVKYCRDCYQRCDIFKMLEAKK